MLPNIVAKSNLDLLRPKLDKIVDRANEFPASGIIAVLNGMMERPMHTVNPNIPFHLIGGDEDKFIPDTVYKKMAQDNPGIRFDMIKGVGHASFVEFPEKTALVVKNYVGSINKLD